MLLSNPLLWTIFDTVYFLLIQIICFQPFPPCSSCPAAWCLALTGSRSPSADSIQITLVLPCASGCFPIFYVFIDWRSSYYVRNNLSTCFTIGKQWEACRRLSSVAGPVKGIVLRLMLRSQNRFSDDLRALFFISILFLSQHSTRAPEPTQTQSSHKELKLNLKLII